MGKENETGACSHTLTHSLCLINIQLYAHGLFTYKSGKGEQGVKHWLFWFFLLCELLLL